MAGNLKRYCPPVDELMENLSTGILVVDSADSVTFLNNAAESVLRISRSKAIGRRLDQLLDHSDVLLGLCRRARQDQATYVQREYQAATLAQPDQQLVIDIAATPLEGGIVVLETRDAHLQVRIDRENSLLAQHGIGRAIARQLAHEIKNPLGGLRGAAQLLARKLGGQGLGEYTDVIIREADRLVKLVDQMLGPAGPTRHEQVNIHRIIDHVHRLLAAEAPANVRIEPDYDPSLPPVTVDEDHMIQAFLNLGRNALQAVGAEGRIVLRTRAISGFTVGDVRHALMLRIDVEDSGPGVPEELIDKVFYPLVTGRTDGTGLGLAVAQDLVNRHGGLVRLMPGPATTFSVFLPAGRALPHTGTHSTDNGERTQ